MDRVFLPFENLRQTRNYLFKLQQPSAKTNYGTNSLMILKKQRTRIVLKTSTKNYMHNQTQLKENYIYV